MTESKPLGLGVVCQVYGATLLPRVRGLPSHIAQVIAGHQDINVTLRWPRCIPARPSPLSWPFLTPAMRPAPQ